MTRKYAKRFTPLESDPEVFTSLLHDLGGSRELHLQDVLSLDEESLLPHPALALVLLYLTHDDYEAQIEADLSANAPDYSTKGREAPCIWFKQTINNACGFYALLHAVCNSGLNEAIAIEGSLLAKIYQKSLDSCPQDCATLLENSAELENIYFAHANHGICTSSPDMLEKVDHHYIAIVKSQKDGMLYVLNGDRNGPQRSSIRLNHNQDLLCDAALHLVRSFLRDEAKGDLEFSLMALVKS